MPSFLFSDSAFDVDLATAAFPLVCKDKTIFVFIIFKHWSTADGENSSETGLCLFILVRLD